MAESEEHTRLRLVRLETLLDIYRELSHELDLDRLLERIASAATQVMDADRCSVYVVDRDHQELWTRVAHGVGEIRMPMDRGVAGRAVTAGELINVTDAYQTPGFDPAWDEKHGYTTRTMLCCPLRGRSGDIIGVFAVLNKCTGLFDDDDEALLQALSAGTAVALENALLVDELRTANRKLSETYDQLLMSEKLSMLGLLAGTLAHDIQNPLAVILGHAEILAMKFPDQPDIDRGADAIVRQTTRITDLVDSIQNYARGSLDTYGPVDLPLVMREALMLTERLLSKYRVEIRQHYEKDMPQAFGNANRLEQVFMNLIQNASQAMAEQGGGKLTIDGQKVVLANECWVEITVSDTGGGIPPEHESGIFDAFFTTKADQKGTGLGLAICQRIMRAHGGEIELHNRPGDGATFVVRIPTDDRREQPS